MAANGHSEVALVLQGGGALGAYECGAVGALLETIDKARHAGREIELKSVTGVSIGAINAACVVGSDSFEDAAGRLNSLWSDLTLHAPDFWSGDMQRDLSLFGLPGFYTPRYDYFSLAQWTSYYDTTPLLATLEKHVNFEKLNVSSTRFVVSAVDVESGELARFCNHDLHGKPRTEIEPKHILASGSLPPQFPWTEIKGRRYWDGGLVNNTPLGDAIDSFSHGDGIDRLLVTINVYPLSAKLPRTMAEVQDRVHELAFGNRLLQDRLTADAVNDLVGTIELLNRQVRREDMSDELKDRVAEALTYKLVKLIDIDMQTRKHGGEAAYDGAEGLRDFSASTVKKRQAVGRSRTFERLSGIFDSPPVASESPAVPEPAPAEA